VNGTKFTLLYLVAVFIIGLGTTTVAAQDVQKPEPAVPEVFTLTGEFVRMAYNNEGFATLGYRVANDSVGEKWMLLDLGLTVQKGVKNQKLQRGAISLQLPDGSTVPLASQEEFAKANLRALDARANMVHDSINYFPVSVTLPCRIGFFTDVGQPARGLAYDQVDLNPQKACVGRVYFNLPDGITTGQYYLNIKFAESALQVPFRILTKEEAKEFKKTWKDIKKEHDAQYTQ
jgi:hypothetical protein